MRKSHGALRHELAKSRRKAFQVERPARGEALMLKRAWCLLGNWSKASGFQVCGGHRGLVCAKAGRLGQV